MQKKMKQSTHLLYDQLVGEQKKALRREVFCASAKLRALNGLLFPVMIGTALGIERALRFQLSEAWLRVIVSAVAGALFAVACKRVMLEPSIRRAVEAKAQPPQRTPGEEPVSSAEPDSRRR